MSSVMRHRLKELEENGTPIKAGVIGAGFFGCSTIRQASRTPGYTLYGVTEKAEIARAENLLPLGLAEKIKVAKRVSTDGVLTYDDVELNEDSFLLKLRRIQDKTF